jgi:hypothetical protein
MRKVSKKSCRENQNTKLSSESHAVYDNVEKFCTAGQATDDNKAHAHFTLDT